MDRWTQFRRQAGMTLVETLAALFILTLVMMMVTSVLLSAQASSRAAERWADQGEQLRMAMNQLGEDIAYARWCCTESGPEIRLHVYQPLPSSEVESLDADGNSAGILSWHSDWSGWSGWFTGAHVLQLRYAIVNGDLVRTVEYEPWDAIYSRQILARELVPYSGTGSRFEVNASRQLVKALLQTARNETGGSGVVEVRGQWHLR
jgi:type II secretory pathway component PulJ